MWSNIILSKGGEDDDRSHPPTRYKHTGVLVPTQGPSNSNYDLYIYGGRSGTFPLKDFWRLDLKCGKWEELRPLPQDDNWPPHLQEHSMVYHEDQIYVFGGEISLSYGEDLSPLWIYSVPEGLWRRWGICPEPKVEKGKKQIKSPDISRQTKTPVGRRGHTALVWNNYMLVYGGYRDLKGSLGDLWAFHFDSESWHLFSSPEIHKKNSRPWYMFSGPSSSNFPSPRHSHISVLHNNSLYIHGGMQDLIELQDLWRFDLKTRQWTNIKTKYGPGPLHGHVGVIALDSLLIMAGERAGKAVDEFWKFDFATEMWERVVVNGCRPCPRVFPWGTVLPMVYKRVQGDPHSASNSFPGESDENKYWWDYDESLTATHAHEDVHPISDPTGQEERRRSSLFSDFTRFAYHNNGDYQALSESNSVCLSEEEASPRPPYNPFNTGARPKWQNGHECQSQKKPEDITNANTNTNGCPSQSLLLSGLNNLNIIKENEGPSVSAVLIDLRDDPDFPDTHNESITVTSSSTDSPDSGDSPQELVNSTFDPVVVGDSNCSNTSNGSNSVGGRPLPPTTRRSESATCLQLNPNKKSGVKKSASVRFADVEPPSTSSQLVLTRECTSDYSSMDNGMNNQGKNTGFENPNYHGSGSSNLFHGHPPPSYKVVEAYEMDAITPEGAGISSLEAVVKGKEEPYYYQVSTPNYMLLIGGNESHSSQVVSKRQPLTIWRLRVTHDLFSTPASGELNGNGRVPLKVPQPQRKATLTTTGF